MKTQKIVNLLNDTVMILQNLQQKKWYVIHVENGVDYGEGNENGISIKFETKKKKKKLNQVFAIIQMHILL